MTPSILARQEPAHGATNHPVVDAHRRLIAKVADEQDDVLCTLLLCRDDAELSERLWGQLVDLLVEGMFLELRRTYLEGGLERDCYVAELTAIAERCRAEGLLPLPARGL